MISTVLREPPIRRIVQQAVRVLPCSIATKGLWDAVERPHYLWGVLYAAQQAQREGRSAVSVIEFGVAEGYGLLTLQAHAAAVAQATGLRISVYGFDSGEGLPAFTGDHREHPDVWCPGDYRMDARRLRRELAPTTHLVLGDVAVTALNQRLDAAIGFMAMDLDLYSSTSAALRILNRVDVPKLTRVGLYFDDIEDHYNHRFAGELLAVDEFNADNKDIKIDRWRGIQHGRPFPEAAWLRAMYMAHDLAALRAVTLRRPPARMR